MTKSQVGGQMFCPGPGGGAGWSDQVSRGWSDQVSGEGG